MKRITYIQFIAREKWECRVSLNLVKKKRIIYMYVTEIYIKLIININNMDVNKEYSV